MTLALDLRTARFDAGHMVVTARAARTGLQAYEDHVERRDAEHVFAPASLETWVGAPIVVGHRWVSAENVDELSVGYVRAVEREDVGEVSYVRATLVITDAKTIGAIQRGELGGLSAGYMSKLTDDDPPRQTSIEINHLAIGPAQGWARCGDACAILA